MVYSLDERQEEAVFSDDPYILVAAGPGSGKTAVLTKRFLRLINEGVNPEGVLAITFTNRASSEMKNRIMESDKRLEHPNVSTFHGFSLNLLKKGKEFILYGRKEQAELLKELGIKNTDKIIEKISSYKNLFGDKPEEAFQKYAEGLKKKGAMDLDDLVLEAVKLLENGKEVPGFSHVLVDEFQDINPPQARLLKLLARNGANLFAIGDIDQSIYSFRGADIKGFLEFHKDYPSAKLIMLEKNYRSTEEIVKASNSLIGKNTQGLDKKTTSVKPGGEPVSMVRCRNERGEGEFIVKEIEKLMGGFTNLKAGKEAHPYDFSDFAVLLRTLRQIDAITKAFKRSSIPYNVLSVPEGIYSFTEHLRLLDVRDKGVGFSGFIKDEALRFGIDKSSIETLTDISSYFDSTEDFSSAKNSFIEYLTLIQPSDTYDIKAKKVSIMTLHSSKGLEFPIVFIAGVEEGLVPLKGEKTDIEEERRLFYVGITRAKERVYLLNVEKRRAYGGVFLQKDSRFIEELGQASLKETVFKKQRTRPRQQGLFEGNGF